MDRYIYLSSSPFVSTNRTKYIRAEKIEFSLKIEFYEYNTAGCMKRWGREQERHEFSSSFSFSMLQPYYRHYVAVNNTVQLHFFRAFL